LTLQALLFKQVANQRTHMGIINFNMLFNNQRVGFMIEIAFDKAGGLVPAIAQDWRTGEVLMLAYMNREAWEMTLSTGLATYFSRSRNTLWVKGKTSGNLQTVKEIRIDCDNDTILLKIDQGDGAACHLGYRSCFFKKVMGDRTQVDSRPVFDPKEVYRK